MVGLRKIALLLVVAAPLTSGCATLGGLKRDLANLTPSPLAADPVVNTPCGWQQRLASLPDPTRNGAPTLGLVGQLFLLDSKGKPSDPKGQLTITVMDATDRGMTPSPHKAEVWNFDNATLKRLLSNDEKFGKFYTLFLPWPEAWRDVTRVKIQLRYDQPNLEPLYTTETVLSLDFSNSAGYGPAGAAGGASFVPNPNEMLNQARQQNSRNRPMPNGTPMYGQAPGMQPIPWNQGPPAQPQQPVQQTGYQYQAGPPQSPPPSSAGGIAPVDIPLKFPGQ